MHNNTSAHVCACVRAWECALLFGDILNAYEESLNVELFPEFVCKMAISIHMYIYKYFSACISVSEGLACAI